MVPDNICHFLRNAIHCSAYTHVVFCWVMYQQEIIDYLLNVIPTESCHVKVISLTCDEASLQARLMQDIADGRCTADILERSTARLPLYQALDSVKLDTSGKSPEAVVKEIPAI